MDEFEQVVSSLAEEDAPEETIEEAPCVWCGRMREVVFGVAAIGIAIVFLYIGIDLASNGALSARFREVNDDDAGTDD